MPLQGILKGDFSSFVEAVGKAETALKDFQSDADKVQASLNKMGDAFSGKKVIQDAELATKAIKDIGGATTLTQSEQAKLNALLTEAIAKYNALGQEAPADMQKLAKETAGAQQATTDIVGAVGKLAAAAGIGFSIGAVVNFGKSVFESASKIGDLAKQLGVSTDAVQGFKFAAEQSGSTLDAVGASIQKMNQNLGAGSNSTVQALKALGISFADVRNQHPEDTFLDITDALAKVTDPMKEARLQQELFGKGSAELTAAIKEGFRQQSDAALKMSKPTIAALKDAQDAWSKLANTATIVSGELIVAAGNVAASMFSLQRSGKEWLMFLENSIKFGPGTAAAMMDVAAAADHVAASVGKVPSRGQLFGGKPPLTQEQEDAIKRQTELLQHLRDEIFGADLETAAKNYVSALGSIANLSKVSSVEQDKINKALGEAIEVYKRFGQTAPPAMLALYSATVRIPDVVDTATLSIKNLGHEVELTIPTIAQMPKVFDGISTEVEAMLNKVRVGMPEIPKQAKLATASLGDLSQALSQLAQVSGGTFSGIVSSLSSMVAAANTAKTSIELMKSAGKETSKLSGILDMASGITGIVSAAIAAGQAVAALFKLFDRNKGRDVVVDFAETFGGFDALHVKLLELGADGEALWIKLTQGVGRNNPAQAQKVIDEVTAALDKQAAKTDDATSATEEQAQATIETASQAAKALEELGPKLDENAQQWKDWGAIVTGVLQEIANTVRQLPLPSASGGLPFSAGSGGGSTSFQLNSNTYLDGKQVAENTAYHIFN